MKLQYCLTGMLLLSLNVFSQLKIPGIGDIVPPVQIKNIYNAPALESNLSAYKDQLLILDFMATNCSSCIKALPRFDSLQKVYGTRLQILLVTDQSAAKVKDFLLNHPSLSLPMVAADTVLSKLFPHRFISHEVWIKDGKVKAITYPEYVNSDNISALLAGENMRLPLKNDDDTCRRYSITQLYLLSYGLSWYPAKRVVLEVADSSRFIYHENYGYKEEWRQRNTFCISSLPIAPGKIGMRNILDTYFGLYGRIEKREVQCLVLKVAPATKVSTLLNSGTRKISRNALLYALGETYCPVIDETPASVTQAVVNNDYLSDIPLLQKTLLSSGLQLVSEAREIELLVISGPIINSKK